MSRATLARACALLIAGAAAGCRGEAELAPPEIRYGESVCVECDMIISDERFAAAILVEGPRGPEARLFDDIGDLLAHEKGRPELRVLARYVHDLGTREWLEAGSAVFLRSPTLHTPMVSGIAAFADRAGAERQSAETPGEILSLDGLR
jgi:copper chaperone NosL